VQESNLSDAVAVFVSCLYQSTSPTKRNLKKQRKQTIRDLYAKGIHPNKIAAQFGITPERVYQIIKSN